MEDYNDLIAKFMGYERVTIGYFDCEDETQWQKDNQDWLDKVKLEMVGDYYVNVSTDEFYNIGYDELLYTEWNNLMKVVEKIESMWYEVSIIGNECEIGENIDAEHYRGIVVCREEEQKSKLMSVFSTIIQFIKWYNQNK